MGLARNVIRGCAVMALPVAAAGLTAGCGSSSSAPAGTGSTSAGTPAAAPSTSPAAAVAKATSCSVVTRAEAAAALGQPVRAPVLGKATVEGGVACVFFGPGLPPGTSPDVGLPGEVRVVLVIGPDAKKWFDNYRSKVHAQPIAGLGDEAYYDGGASVSVLEGDAYVRIAVAKADNLGAEKTLARDALPRM